MNRGKRKKVNVKKRLKDESYREIDDKGVSQN
jgi:hypothetical protein